jgi:hypothetical protein
MTVEQVNAMRDAKWQARERAYHNEAIKDLNNTVRKMVSLSEGVAA